MIPGELFPAEGTLTLGSANQMSDTGSLSVASGATLNLGGFSDTVGDVSLTGGSIINGTLNSSSTFTIEEGTVSVILGGSGSVLKTTTASATLAAANTYTGLTWVREGTLAMGLSNAVAAASDLTFASTVAHDKAEELKRENYYRLAPGEILVAPITDVGWTPYFSMIAGLVTDVGSAVSHGAVIAREYGLPAIVNTRTATRIINTGDRIRLDADTGTVTLL